MSESSGPRSWFYRISLGVLNMTMRGLGLLGRFALMLYLARFLDLDSVAIFGLAYAAVAMAPAFLNFGLHFRMNREIVGSTVLETGHRLRDRFLLHILVYVPLTLVAVAVASALGWLVHVNTQVVAIVLVIGLLDVLLNEVHLVLISSQRPVLANIVYFMRSAVWIFPYMTASFFVPELRSLECLFEFWLGGQLVAFAVFFGALNHWPWRSIGTKQRDFQWLFVDIQKSAMFWVSDIGSTAGQFIDRFILGIWLDTHSIGIYIFFWSMANGVQQLVYTAVVQIMFPYFVKSARTANKKEFKLLILTEMRNVFFVSALIGIVVFAISPAIYRLTGRAGLSDHGMIFAALLVGTSIRLVADVVGTGLYARSLDAHLVAINIATPIISVIFTVAALASFGFGGIGFAFVGTNLAILALRLASLRQAF